MEPIVKPFSAEDLPQVLEIERESQPEPWTAVQFLDELQNPLSRFWVARLCASGSGRLRGDRFLLETPCGSPQWSLLAGYICTWFVADEIQILNIAVAPAFRRRGVGRLLLGHALAAGVVTGARLAVLEVRRSNTTAQRLYQAFGFAVIGERSGYYTVQPEAAVVMQLSLAATC